MSDPGVALRTALYTALDDALSVSVYDFVPQDAPYPYVAFSTEQSLNDDMLSSRKEQKDIYLAVYSTYRGQKEVLEIMATMSDTLHNNRLALSVGRIADIKVVEKDINPEPDGVTYMGQVRLRVLVEHG